MSDARHAAYRRQALEDREPALVRNAADVGERNAADQLEEQRRRRAVQDMRTVLALAEGRRVLWGLLVSCGLEQSCLGSSEGMTYYNVGIHALGLEFRRQILEADDEGYVRMEREARALARQEQTEMARHRRPEEDA